MTGKHGNHWRHPVVRVAIACEVCGTVREYTPSQAKRRTGRFCSQACVGKSKDTRIMVPCLICGVEVLRRRQNANLPSYCSPAHAKQAKRVNGAKWRDRDQIKQHMRDYTDRNRTKHNESGARWARENRGKRNELQRMRRASYTGQFTESDWVAIKRTHHFTCLRCKRQESLLVKLQPDHVVALARGGAHQPSNIQPLCGSCNAWKGAKTIDYRVEITEVRA